MQRISTRLAVSFLIVALLPAVPLSLVVRDLLERRFGPAIAVPLEQALESGLDESRQRLAERRQYLRQRAEALPDGGIDLVLLNQEGRPVSANALLAAHPNFLRMAGDLISPPEPGRSAEPVRLDSLLVTAVGRSAGKPRYVVQPLPPGMFERAGHMTEGLSLLRTVSNEHGRVLLSFIAPFLVIYGVLILLALVAGALWARRMVRPLEALVAGTRRVGAGDFEFRVDRDGPGEVGELVRAFDAMIGRLAEQRRDLGRLERAAAWRGMARTLAHEVKNPLTPILLAVQQLRDNYQGDDPAYRELVEECADIVGEEVESLRALVREFGDFARLPRPIPRPGDLAKLLRDVEALYGKDRVAVSTPPELNGWFDGPALKRSLINLVDNGLAACAEAGRPERVELIAEAADPGARITVRDGGVGIPGENIERIFTPDFTTKGGGMGLGLAVVDSMVAGHGGTIGVSSEPGSGACFTIALPLTEIRAETPREGDEES